VRGASALDQLLAEFPEARLRVQVVWEPVLKSDIAAPLTRVLGLLKDRRVTQYWDPDRVVSTDLVRSVNGAPSRYGREEALPPDFIAWDVVAVFSSTAKWESDLPTPVHYDGPVVHAIDATRKAITDALAARSPRNSCSRSKISNDPSPDNSRVVRDTIGLVGNSTQTLRTSMEAMDAGGSHGQKIGRRFRNCLKRRPSSFPS